MVGINGNGCKTVPAGLTSNSQGAHETPENRYLIYVQNTTTHGTTEIQH